MRNLNRIKASAIITIITALIALPIQPIFASETETVVTFKDANLEDLVRSTLSLSETEDITTSNILQLRDFKGQSSNITSLSGLEHATNMEDIWMPMNEVSDLSPLSSLDGLDRLVMYKNNISDLTPIQNLPNLTYLDLEDNNITDFSPLLNLVNLQSVHLDDNPFPNEEQKEILFTLQNNGVNVYFDGVTFPLETLYITSITDGAAQIHWGNNSWNTFSSYKIYINNSLVGEFQKDDSPITASGLTPSTDYEVRLDGIGANGEVINSRTIRFTTEALPEGEVITFNDTNLETAIKTELNIIHRDVYSSELSSLSNLTLKNYGITDISDIDQIPQLRELNLSDNTIQDVSVLENLVSLTNLSMSNNNISDLGSYAGLTQLEWLSLSTNNVSDLTPISGLTNLTNLYLANNAIKDLSPIVSLQGLTHLNISGNPVESYEPVTKLVNLESLDAENMGIQDISFLRNLPNLYRLVLDNNNISDLSVLEELPNLQYLFIENNGLELFTGFEDYEIIQRLRAKGVSVYAEEQYHDSTETDYSITIYWDKLKAKGVFTSYELYLEDQLVATLTGDQTEYTFEDLTPLTYYNIDLKAYIGDELGYTEDASQSTTKTTWQDGGVVTNPDNGEPNPFDKFIFVEPEVNDGVTTLPGLEEKDIKEGSNVYVSLYDYEFDKVHLKLPASQVEKLRASNSNLVVNYTGINLTFPASNLPTNGDADIVIDKVKWSLLDHIVSDVYDFTVIQGGKVISEFDNPVRLTFKVDSSKVSRPENLGVYYYNESNQEWEYIGGDYNSETGYISAVTDHFSIYAVLEMSDEDESPSGNSGDNNSGSKTNDETVNSDPNNDSSDNIDKVETDTRTSEKGTDNTVDNTRENSEEGKPLPNTSSNYYTYMAIGTCLVLIGLFAFVIRRRINTQ